MRIKEGQVWKYSILDGEAVAVYRVKALKSKTRCILENLRGEVTNADFNVTAFEDGTRWQLAKDIPDTHYTGHCPECHRTKEIPVNDYLCGDCRNKL